MTYSFNKLPRTGTENQIIDVVLTRALCNGLEQTSFKMRWDVAVAANGRKVGCWVKA